MYIHSILHGLILSASVTYAFFPYVPSSHDTWKGWRSVKSVLRGRDAESFLPIMPAGSGSKELEGRKWLPVVPRDETLAVKVKSLPRADNGLHPEIRHVQQANRMTRKYRLRSAAGPQIDENLAIRNVIESIERRGQTVQRRGEILKSHDPTTPNSIAVDQDGQDMSYFVEINFGSKNKTFLLALDTGSSDMWISSANCSSPACLAHKTFSDGDSSTTGKTEKVFQIKYGSGEVDGVVVTDYVSFGGFRVNIEFGLAQSVSDEFLNFPIDGILGLGFMEASQEQVKTIMDVLVDNGLIKNKLFAIALSRAQDGLNDGVLNFGGIDKSYFAGEINYCASISSKGLWEIDVGNISYDGVSFDFPQRTAVIDTGTSLILIPKDDALKVHAVIPGAQTNGETFAVPCGTNVTLEFTFSGITYKIPAVDWVGGAINQSQNLCLSHLLAREILGPDVWLLGDVFLKNVYTVFDMDHFRVGFGMRSSPQSSGASSSPQSTYTGISPSPTHSITSSLSPGSKANDSRSDVGGAAAASSVIHFVFTAVVTSIITLVIVL